MVIPEQCHIHRFCCVSIVLCNSSPSCFDDKARSSFSFKCQFLVLCRQNVHFHLQSTQTTFVHHIRSNRLIKPFRLDFALVLTSASFLIEPRLTWIHFGFKRILNRAQTPWFPFGWGHTKVGVQHTIVAMWTCLGDHLHMHCLFHATLHNSWI